MRMDILAINKGEKMDAKLRAFGEVALNMSHEIKNPLAVLLMCADIMRDELEKDSLPKSKALKMIGDIERAGLRIEQIIDSVWDMSLQIQTKTPEQVALKAIIEETLDFTRHRFIKNNVSFYITGLSHKTELRCQAIQVSQVLINLLNNALDAVEEMDEKWVQLEIKENNSTVFITVSDNGKGVPEDYKEKIMQPFFTTKGVGPKKGLGLGLSISKCIAEAHGGQLTLDNARPHTSFVLSLPKSGA